MVAAAFLEDPLFKCYAFYSAILIIKMLIMSPLTGRLRMSKGVFSNPEDVKSFSKKSDAKVNLNDPEVERVRRAHLNDLENIPAFLFISALYMLTGPQLTLATTLMRVFTFARIAHTVVYAVCVVRQPARGLAWGIGFAVTFYMAIQVLLTFCCN